MLQAFVFLNLFLFSSLFFLSGEIARSFNAKKENLLLTHLLPEEEPNEEHLFHLSSTEAALQLDMAPYQLTLPDLRDQIQFLGRSLRPDVNENEKILFLKISGNNEIKSVKEKEKIYLSYNYSSPNSRYQFSELNNKTALCIEITLQNENSIEVSTSLKGQSSESSDEQKKFILQVKPNSSEPWLMNELKVDQTYLIRERAKYCGKDLFLELHGGEEFAFEKERVRIDFEQQEPYALFVKENDLLLLENNRWVNNGIAKNETRDRILMVVKSIDDHFIHFELFNPLGDQKVSLKIIKSRNQNNCCPQLVTSQMRFIQAKTWSQFIVELQGERKTLRTGDWLIFIDHKWQIIDSSELIDQYVASQIIAPLFIIDELQKQKGQKVITGHLFCPTRTEVVPIELVQQNEIGNPTHMSVLTKTEQYFEEQS